MRRAFAPFALKIAVLQGFVLGAAGLAGSLSAACGSGGASDTLPPITGVIVRAESLTTGRGCGRGAEQVFKYAAVLIGKGDTGLFDRFIAGNVYDCFADGLFVDLPASGGAFEYRVQIYAYNEAAYGPSAAQIASKTQTVTGLRDTSPTFTTTCNAVQIDLVQTLAVCKPLTLGTGGIDTTPTPVGEARVDLETGSFPGPDGGTLRCDVDYAVVRSRFSVVVDGKRSALSEPIETRCGTIDADAAAPKFATVSVLSAIKPARYDFDVALLGTGGTAGGVLRGSATCTAATSPGLTSTASCKPVP